MFKRLIGAGVVALVLALAAVFVSTEVAPASEFYPITVKQQNVEPGGRGCVDGEWHLLINQIDGESLAPSSIEVAFSDGHTHTVDLSKFTGQVAHYFIFDHLTDTLVTATAIIYNG